MYRLSNIKIRENLTEEKVVAQALKKYNINAQNVKEAYIYKRSIDARNKSDIYYSYVVDVKLNKDIKVKGAKDIDEEQLPKIQKTRKSSYKPVIVGAGPAGLFTAITLVDNGIEPIIIEQGSKVEKRIEEVNNFIERGVLNTKTNIQFGEGGAGTFSDGKLTTGNTSVFSGKVLEEFVKFGAPKEIMYIAKPHIGTDNLVNIVRNMREYIISKGGTFLFDTKVTDFVIENNEIKGVVCDNKEKVETDTVILAIGHSARDTFKKLLEKNVNMIPKNFAIGARIEHLKEDINVAQYGKEPKFSLPPAEYKLVYHASNGRTCYTFCMCPGGQVMASSSEENTIVTNGMSKFSRDGKNANSALLVNVTPDDAKGDSPLKGMYLQEELERKAFDMGGKNYFAPIQRVGDFLNNVKSTKIGKVESTYKPGVTLSNLNELFPEYISQTLKEAIINLDKKLKGFANEDAILTAVETRTSSPVQILREKESLMSNIKGLFPCGEGAGYAGGIMTASVDGIKVAIEVLRYN